jgi:hypothetical protein
MRVVAPVCRAYARPMSNLHSKHDGRDARGSEVGGRLARAAGRLLLWGCVLLLVRGVVAYLSSDSRVVTTTRGVTVTVTQPARTDLPSAERK